MLISAIDALIPKSASSVIVFLKPFSLKKASLFITKHAPLTPKRVLNVDKDNLEERFIL